MAEIDPTQTLSTLSTTLTSLEESLAPLLATPFEELSQDLDPLQKAKLEVMTGYVVHDLIWIYLKTSGVDPNTHPVMLELQRLKTYFDKIKHAEQGPEKPRMTLDKGAASRFINAAISSSRSKVDPFYIAEEGNAAAGPSGTHTRFGTEGEEVEKLLEDDDDEEEESDDEDAEDAIVQAMVVEEETKGKKAEKKERPRMDPFAGYDSPKAQKTKSSNKSTPKAATPSSQEKRKRADEPAEVASGTPTGGLSKNAKKKLAFKKAKTGGGA